MSAYMVRLTLQVCKAIGCNKQATQSVWDDDKHCGDYCRVHGLDLVRALTEAKERDEHEQQTTRV